MHFEVNRARFTSSFDPTGKVHYSMNIDELHVCDSHIGIQCFHHKLHDAVIIVNLAVTAKAHVGYQQLKSPLPLSSPPPPPRPTHGT